MLANDVGLDLAGAAANGGREIVHVGALPKAAFNRVLVSHVERTRSTLKGQRVLPHTTEELCTTQFGG